MGRGAALRTRSDQRLPQGACGFPGNIPPPGNWPGCDNVQGAAEAASFSGLGTRFSLLPPLKEGMGDLLLIPSSKARGFRRSCTSAERAASIQPLPPTLAATASRAPAMPVRFPLVPFLLAGALAAVPASAQDEYVVDLSQIDPA